MILEKNKILLTEADQQRFTFHHEEDPNTQENLQRFKKTFTGITVVLSALLVLMAFLATRISNRGVLIAITVFAVIDVLVIFINYAMYRDSIKKIDQYNHFIEVEIVEKLPIKDAEGNRKDADGEPIHFYPVKGRDTAKKNYTSTCFLTKKEYETFHVGDKIRLMVPADIETQKK